MTLRNESEGTATRFNVVIPGETRCDDWVDLDEALQQAEAFLGLGVDRIVIERGETDAT